MRKSEKEYIIETFEASPPAAEVLSAETALQWDFPSRAVAISPSTFEDSMFQASLAEFIERSSVEPVKQFAATTLKAGSLAFESRDTPTPAIIGQLLMAILEANGRKHTATLTRKRIRDEVCWSDGAEKSVETKCRLASTTCWPSAKSVLPAWWPYRHPTLQVFHVLHDELALERTLRARLISSRPTRFRKDQACTSSGKVTATEG